MSEVNNALPANMKPTGDFALTRDWPYESTSQQRIYKLFKTGGGTFDFVIGLEPPFTKMDDRVYIHKAIVAASSPVLRKLIATSHKAGHWYFNMHAATEEYGKVDALQFKQLIEFIYTDSIRDLEEWEKVEGLTEERKQEKIRVVRSLNALAKTFQIPGLATYSTSKLMEDTTKPKQVPAQNLYGRPILPQVAVSPAATQKSPKTGAISGDLVNTVKGQDQGKSMEEGKGNNGVKSTKRQIPGTGKDNTFKSNIVKEVVAELKGKLVAELEKDLLAEIKDEVNKSDLHGQIMDELANKIRNSFNL